MCKTLAKTLGIPISMSDCTTFTQAGYIGDDVEQCVSRLFAAAGQDVEATEHGIIVLDEIDKIASAKMAHGKDVGGEGVQQALLKIIEGTTVQVRAKPEKTSKNPSTTYSGYSTPLDGTRSPMSGGSPSNGKEETYTVRTDNILFICTGAFANLHKIILDRKSMGGIGFGASIRSSNAHASTDGVMLKGAQATLFKKDSPFFVPPEPAPSPFGVQPPAREETVNVLDHIQPADLQKYGMIPELIGRIPTVCAVSSLDEDALVRVLTEPKDSLLRQETHKFFLRNMELRITTPALREIARKAAKMGTGARGLRHVVDSLLLQTKYETPGMFPCTLSISKYLPRKKGSSVKHILVTRDVARLKCAPLYFHRGQAAAFSAELARDEEAWDAELRGREDEASGGRGHGQGHGHGHVGSFEEYRKAGAGGF
jgi:ATP-dependent Clp protease ATP-binding subunit ClpX